MTEKQRMLFLRRKRQFSLWAAMDHVFTPIGRRCTKSLQTCIKFNFVVLPDTPTSNHSCRQISLKANDLRSLCHRKPLHV